jgi:hypothetical protein
VTALTSQAYLVLSGLATQLAVEPIWSTSSGDAQSDVNGWLGYVLSDTIRTPQLAAVREQVRVALSMNVTPDAAIMFRYYRGLIDANSGPPVLANVSNRARSNSSAAAAAGTTWSSVSYHTLFCGAGRSLASLQVAWDNWFANGTESGSGGSNTIKLWIEYPVGVAARQPVTWGGLATGTIADATTQYCDAVTLNTPIPDGAKVGIWAEQVIGAALVFGEAHNKSTAWGDSMNVGTTGMTASSAKPTDSGGAYFGPSSIRGLTTARSIVAVGDSRLVGVLDFATATDGLNGEVGRTFGPQHAVMTIACAGELGSQFVANHTLRLALAQDGNYLIYEYGVNDCVGSSGAVVDGVATSAKALAWPAGMRKTRITLAPASTSTNSFIAADGSDQTTRAYNPALQAYNVLVRANASGWDAVYDFAAVNELAPIGTGKWQSDGTAFKWTGDGVHETTAGNQRYAAAFPTLL